MRSTQRSAAALASGLGIVFTVSAIFASLNANAETDGILLQPDHYLVAGVTYSELDSGRGADFGTGATLAYGWRLGAERWWEARFSTAVLDTGTGGLIDYYQTGLGLDVLQPLGENSRNHFFAVAGLGGVLNDVNPDSKSGFSANGNLGIGWRARTWDLWGLHPRVEARVIYDSFDSGQIDIQLGFSLEIPPDPVRQVDKLLEVERIVEVPVIVEVIVEKEGVCVVPTASAAPAPAGAVDTDGDGVPDGQDQCPQTLPGAKVNADGCVKEKQTVSLPNIEFEPASTVLAKGGKVNLESVVSFLQNQKNVQVDVFGHTDSQGADAYNMKLSEGRARAVMDYLLSRGVDKARLTSKGFGETQPIASNETEGGRAENRRVELLLRMQ